MTFYEKKMHKIIVITFFLHFSAVTAVLFYIAET